MRMSLRGESVSEKRCNQSGSCPHENKPNENLAFFPDLLDITDDLSQIFQCFYDFVRDLSACLEHSSAQRHRSYDWCLYLERGGLCLERKQYNPELPPPSIHPRGRVGLHLLYDRSVLSHLARAWRINSLRRSTSEQLVFAMKPRAWVKWTSGSSASKLKSKTGLSL